MSPPPSLSSTPHFAPFAFELTVQARLPLNSESSGAKMTGMTWPMKSHELTTATHRCARGLHDTATIKYSVMDGGVPPETDTSPMELLAVDGYWRRENLLCSH